MKRRIQLIIGVIIIAIIAWLWAQTSSIVNAQKQVIERFHEMTASYAEMRTRYVAPLLALSNLSSEERKDLEKIAADMESLLPSSKNSIDAQYTRLLALQREIISFLSDAVVSENLSGNIVEWSTNASNRGEASLVVHKYNEALAAYNALVKSGVGHTISTLVTKWEYPLYLSVDGTTQVETTINF